MEPDLRPQTETKNSKEENTMITNSKGIRTLLLLLAVTTGVLALGTGQAYS